MCSLVNVIKLYLYVNFEVVDDQKQSNQGLNSKLIAYCRLFR